MRAMVRVVRPDINEKDHPSQAMMQKSGLV